MNTLTRPAIKRSIVTVNNVAHRFAAVRPQRFDLMFPHSRSLLIAAPQFQTTVVSKNIDPVRKFNGVGASNVPVMRYSTTTSNYELLYEKEQADHAVTKRELRLEFEARIEAELKLNLANNTIIELRMILGFRSEIEALEVFLWPSNLSKKTDRLEVWVDILTSVKPEFTSSAIIMEFRKRLSEKDLSVDFFIRKCLLKFYEQSSSLGGHTIKFPNRSKVTRAVVENVLDYLGLPSHTAYVSSVELLLKPIESLQ